MENKQLSECPVCGGELTITGLKCKKCDTHIQGEFALNKFSKLNADQLYFVEVFIKCRGNIKEVEKEMGISYPTVRNKLDEVIAALGYRLQESPEDTSSQERKEILDKLEKGEIDPKEASKLLKNA